VIASKNVNGLVLIREEYHFSWSFKVVLRGEITS